MSVTVSLSPIWSASQFFNNSGAVLANGFIKTFVGGSYTTLAPTYTNNTGTVANPNPIPLDANGRSPEIWLVEGTNYNFALYGADGVTIIQQAPNIIRGIPQTQYVPIPGGTMTGQLVSPNLNLTGPLYVNSNNGLAGQVLTSTGGTTTPIWSAAGGSGFVVNPQTVTSYTTVLSDANALITMTNSASNTLILAPSLYSVGTTINFAQLGAGQTTIAGGTGVTVNSASSLNLRAQYSMGTAVLVATNEWLLSGDLA